MPHETICADYALTETYQDSGGALFDVDPEGPFAYLLAIDRDVWRTMMRSAPEYIDAAFAALVERHGSVEAWLGAAHGIDVHAIDQLKALLLE